MTEIAGWKYVFYKSVGSTNDEIKKFCDKPKQKIVIHAEEQTAGRGRFGRKWISDKGNLFFSAAFEFDFENIGSLVMISALSVAQTIESLLPEVKPELKWPNDVLIYGAKISGILLEKGEGNYMITGIGININSAPTAENLVYSTACLKDFGLKCSPEEFLKCFLEKFNYNSGLIENNKKEDLRLNWLKRAYRIGQEISVRQNGKEECGIFKGIDEDMALLLQQNDQIKKIVVGDVFYKEV